MPPPHPRGSLRASALNVTTLTMLSGLCRSRVLRVPNEDGHIFIKSRESNSCVTIFFCPPVFQLHNCSCHIWDPFRAINTSCGCCKFSLGFVFCTFLWCSLSDRAGLFEWLQMHRYDSSTPRPWPIQPIFTSVNVRNLTYPSCKPPVWSVSGVLSVVMKTESRKRLLRAAF